MGDASQWVAYQALRGSWRDQQGRAYEFNEGGVARIGGAPARYDVCLDMVSCGGDILELDGIPHGFELRRDSLKIFSARELDWGFEVSRKDPTVLRRTHKAP